MVYITAYLIRVWSLGMTYHGPGYYYCIGATLIMNTLVLMARYRHEKDSRLMYIGKIYEIQNRKNERKIEAYKMADQV